MQLRALFNEWRLSYYHPQWVIKQSSLYYYKDGVRTHTRRRWRRRQWAPQYSNLSLRYSFFYFIDRLLTSVNLFPFTAGDDNFDRWSRRIVNIDIIIIIIQLHKLLLATHKKRGNCVSCELALLSLSVRSYNGTLYFVHFVVFTASVIFAWNL